MLHGDISNSRSFVIGVRCENTLFKIKDSPIPFPFSYKLKHAEVDEKVLSLINYLYWDTEMTVMLVIDDKHYTDKVAEFLKDYPFSQICNIKSLSEITMMLNVGDLSYFVDNDKIELHNINSRYAVQFYEFDSMLKRNRKVLRYET